MIALLLLACGDSAPADTVDKPPPPIVEEKAVPLVLPAQPDLGERPTDCLLDLDGIQPGLASEQEGAKVMVSRKGRVTESFNWPNGTPVRVSAGGCSHIGIEQEFGIAEAPEDLYAAALAFTKRLQHDDDSLNMITGKLVEAGKLGEGGAFDCGDAMCNVTVRTDGPNPVLVIAYDFAL